MQAQIKDVPGFEGLYKAHEYGFIISCAKEWISGMNGQLLRTKPETCLKPGIDKDGYTRVTLMKEGKPHYLRAGRVIALAFHTNPENKSQVNHKDGKKWNSAARNIEWNTDKENKRHAWDTGLKIASKQKTGGKNCKAKLTDQQAAEIRASAESHRVIAKKYGVHHAVVYGIKKEHVTQSQNRI